MQYMYRIYTFVNNIQDVIYSTKLRIYLLDSSSNPLDN